MISGSQGSLPQEPPGPSGEGGHGGPSSGPGLPGSDQGGPSPGPERSGSDGGPAFSGTSSQTGAKICIRDRKAWRSVAPPDIASCALRNSEITASQAENCSS